MLIENWKIWEKNLRKKITEEIKEELRKEIKEEIREKVTKEVTEEIREKVTKEIIKEIITKEVTEKVSAEKDPIAIKSLVKVGKKLGQNFDEMCVYIAENLDIPLDKVKEQVKLSWN